MTAVVNAVVVEGLVRKAVVVICSSRSASHHQTSHIVQASCRSMGSILRRILVLDKFTELFARSALFLATLSFDFGPDHETTNVGLASYQEIMSIRSLGFTTADANKVVNVQSEVVMRKSVSVCMRLIERLFPLHVFCNTYCL